MQLVLPLIEPRNIDLEMHFGLNTCMLSSLDGEGKSHPLGFDIFIGNVRPGCWCRGGGSG